MYIYIYRQRQRLCLQKPLPDSIENKRFIEKKKKNLYTRIFTPYLILNSIAAENKQTSKKN